MKQENFLDRHNCKGKVSCCQAFLGKLSHTCRIYFERSAMESIIYIRVKQLCDEKDISISKLESELGMSQNSINKWNTGLPSLKSISKVAKYFNVSLDYLTGASDIRTTSDSVLDDPDYVKLLRARERMTPLEKQRMMSILELSFAHAFEEDGNDSK